MRSREYGLIDYAMECGYELDFEGKSNIFTGYLFHGQFECALSFLDKQSPEERVELLLYAVLQLDSMLALTSDLEQKLNISIAESEETLERINEKPS